MFAKIAIFSCLLAIALSAPAGQEPVAINSQNAEVNPDGSFQWNYEAADGTAQQQSGHLVGSGENVGEAVSGSASWVDKEGNQHQVNYVADENGYQPQSADIPQDHPVPEAIQKSLEWNAAHPNEE